MIVKKVCGHVCDLECGADNEPLLYLPTIRVALGTAVDFLAPTFHTAPLCGGSHMQQLRWFNMCMGPLGVWEMDRKVVGKLRGRRVGYYW